MKRGLTLLAVILAALLSPKIEAQILDQVTQPLDRSKQADVNQKTLSFGDVPMNTLSQPLKDFTPVRRSRRATSNSSSLIRKRRNSTYCR